MTDNNNPLTSSPCSRQDELWQTDKFRRSHRNAWWVIAFLLILFIAVQIIGGSIAMALYPIFHSDQAFTLTTPSCKEWMGSALFFINLTVIVLAWAFRLIRPDFYRFRTTPTAKKGWLGVLAFLFIAFGVNFLTAPLDLQDGGVNKMLEGMLDNPLAIAAVALVGPIAEECILREGVLRQMLRAHLRLPLALFLSSLLFAVIHGNLAQGIPALLLGLILGLLYVKVGDIRLSALAHILNNSLSVAFVFLPASLNILENTPLYYSLSLGVALVAIGSSMLYTWWKK